MSIHSESAAKAKLENPEADEDLETGSEFEAEAQEGAESGPGLTEADDVDEVTSNVGETSVELDVDQLIADLENSRDQDSEADGPSPRKRLEDILEQRRVADELRDIDDLEAAEQD